MRKKWIFMGVLILVICFASCKKNSPTIPEIKQTANLTISVTSTPILMTWNFAVELWYIGSIVHVSETIGVGVDVTQLKMVFIYQGGKYEEQSMDGSRINGYGTQSYLVSVGTICNVYEAVEFSVKGQDDNGHTVSRTKQYNLKYVWP